MFHTCLPGDLGCLDLLPIRVTTAHGGASTLFIGAGCCFLFSSPICPSFLPSIPNFSADMPYPDMPLHVWNAACLFLGCQDSNHKLMGDTNGNASVLVQKLPPTAIAGVTYKEVWMFQPIWADSCCLSTAGRDAPPVEFVSVPTLC